MGSSNSLPREINNLYERTWQKPKGETEKRLIQDFDGHVEKVLESLHQADDKPLKQRMELISAAGDKIVETDTLQAICDELASSLKTDAGRGERARVLAAINGDARVQRNNLVENCLECLVILTDPLASDKLCWEVVHHRDLVHLLLTLLRDKRKAPLSKERFSKSLHILHNLAAYDARLRDSYRTLEGGDDKFGRTNQFRRNLENIVSALCLIAKNEDDKAVQLQAITGLACVERRKVSRENMESLLLNLSLALEDQDHKRLECSAVAMERAIRHLLKPEPKPDQELSGIHDKKRSLIDSGVVTILAKGIKVDIDREKQACIDSLWILCQEDDCQGQMAEDESLVDHLLKLHGNQAYKEQAEFIYLNLADHLKKRRKDIYFGKADGYKKLKTQGKDQEKQQRAGQTAAGHVMLSYQHSKKQLVERICNDLKEEGFSTWMDKDEMHRTSNTLDAMAEAVDKSSVFLLCYSKNYETSKYCKKEAQYALHKEKPIIPLRVDEDYKPNNWLGFLLSGLFYFDFTETEATYRESFRKLLDTIRREMNPTLNRGHGSGHMTPRGRKTQTSIEGGDKLDTSRSVQSYGMTTTPRSPRRQYIVAPYCRLHPNAVCRSREDGYSHCCCHYTDPRKEVRDWLRKHRLNSYEVRALTKKDLETLLQLKQEAPEFFYRRIWVDLKMKKVSEIQHFERALMHWGKTNEQ